MAERSMYVALDALPPLTLADEDLTVVYVNAPAAKIFGWPDTSYGVGRAGLHLMIAEDRLRLVRVQDKANMVIGAIQILRGFCIQNIAGDAIAVSGAGGWARHHDQAMRVGTFEPDDQRPTDDALVTYFLRACLALEMADLIDPS